MIMFGRIGQMDTIIVSTYCRVNSYGSILQALGLKNALWDIGYSSKVVQLMPDPPEKYKISCKRFTPKNLAALFSKCLLYSKLNRKHVQTLQFIRETIDTTYYSDYSSMKDALKLERYFIAGSDQIWHPQKMAPEFFLDFATKDAKKISYAASMGILEIPEKNRVEYQRLLNNFDVISVREEDCVPILSELTDKTVNIHIDPTFLCDKMQWRSYQRDYSIEGPYILVYPLYWDSSINQKLEELHKKSGKDIVVISDYKRNIYANKWIYDADPGQFLWLIDHADAVISSSFHGVALALNYNKPIAPVINPAAPSRIMCLLKTVSYPMVDIPVVEETLVDYDVISQKIQAEKERAMDFLKGVLSN